MRNVIDKGTKIPFAAFLNDVQVRAAALHLSELTKNTARTKDEVYEDALKGLALEAAFRKHMNSFPQFKVVKSEDNEYDFKIIVDNEEHLVDVKGRFKENARTYTQSAWERHKTKENNISVTYLCFNCTDGGNAVYEGYALSEDFKPSTKYTGYYIYGDQLR